MQDTAACDAELSRVLDRAANHKRGRPRGDLLAQHRDWRNVDRLSRTRKIEGRRDPRRGANILANGEAFTLPSAEAADVTVVLTAAGAGAAAGLAAGVAAGVAEELFNELSKPETSVPGLPIMAMISFTLADSPAGTPTCSRVPSA